MANRTGELSCCRSGLPIPPRPRANVVTINQSNKPRSARKRHTASFWWDWDKSFDLILTGLSPSIFSPLSHSLLNRTINSAFHSIRQRHNQELNQVNNDIVTLVGSFITQSLADKQAQYEACGCPSCAVRVNQLRSWLAAQPANGLPAENRLPHQSPSPAVMVKQCAWLCHSCLRKVSAPNGHCPNCGTKHHSAG
jgi:hypothetical protein